MVRAGNCLLFLLWGLLLCLCFQGRGSHALFVGVGILPLLVAAAVSVRFRRFVSELCRRHWQKLDNFSKFPEGQIPWQSAAILAAIPMVLLSLSNGKNIPSMDNYPASVVAVSLLREGNTELSEFMPIDAPETPYYFTKTPKGIYSSYPIGMVFFSLPFTAVSWLVRGNIDDGHNQWRLAKFTGACIAGVCAMLFLLVSLLYAPLTGAYLGTWFLMVGSPLWAVIGQGLWSHGGVAVGLLVILFLESRGKKPVPGSHRLLQGFAMALMVSNRLSAGIILVPLALWMATRSFRGALLAVLTSLAFFAPVAAYNVSHFGHFLGPQFLMTSEVGLKATPLYGFIGTLVSPAAGLLVYQPWLWLLPLLFKYRPSGPLRALAIAGGIGFTIHMALIMLWPGWAGGAWGSRYFAEVLPLVLLPLCPLLALLWNEDNGRVVVKILLVLSFSVQAFGVYSRASQWFFLHPKHSDHLPTEERRFLDWTDPPFLYPFGIRR